MKHLIAFALLTLPAMAAASYGPAGSEAEVERLHLTEFAWTSVSSPATPGCTDPTPQGEIFACAVLEPAK